MKDLLQVLAHMQARMDYRLFKLTGIVTPLLRIKWRADARHIQRLLNAQHIQVYAPSITIID